MCNWGFLKVNNVVKDFCSNYQLFQKVIFFKKDTSLNSARIFEFNFRVKKTLENIQWVCSFFFIL